MTPVSRLHITSFVSHLLSSVLHLLSHVSCLSVLCLLSHVSCPYFMSPVSQFLTLISHLLSHVSCLLSTILRFLSQVYGLAHLSCQSHVIYTGIDLAELAV